MPLKTEPERVLNHTAEWLLGSLCLLLLVILIIISQYTIRTPDFSTVSVATSDSTRNSTKQSMPPDFAQSAPIDSYIEIIRRPLFNEDRKPYIPKPEEESVEETELEETMADDPWREDIKFFLSGIIRTPEKNIALLHSDQNKDIYRLSIGQSALGWTLTEIQQRSVTLSLEGDTQTVMLEIASALPYRERRNDRDIPSDISDVEYRDNLDDIRSIRDNPPIPIRKDSMRKSKKYDDMSIPPEFR